MAVRKTPLESHCGHEEEWKADGRDWSVSREEEDEILGDHGGLSDLWL